MRCCVADSIRELEDCKKKERKGEETRRKFDLLLENVGIICTVYKRPDVRIA
jgi:hypothetical protein